MKNKVLQIDRENITPINELRARLIKAQTVFKPRINFELYEMYYGELSPQEKSHVQNVWLFKAMDEQVVENWERIAKDAIAKEEKRKREEQFSHDTAIAFDINETSARNKKLRKSK